MRLTVLGSLAVLLPCVAQSPAWAQDCGPLKQINSVDLAGASNRPLVPVSLNGIPKLFLLDTGGDVSQINGTVAQELGLPLRDANVKMLDMYGHASTKMTRVEKFTIGRQTGDIDLGIQPNPNFGVGTRFVGIFAPDLMARNDVEMDFGAFKMNYFLSDHCPGHVVYWQHDALAVVPMTFHKRHIRLPVKLDGKELTAEIDTGSGNTNMAAEAAKRLFDIVPETPGNVPLNARGMAAAFGRVFSSLDFEGVAVKNPHIVIRPDLIGSKDPNNGFRTDTRARMVDDLEGRPDLLIGMDVLKNLHLYFAFGESQIYISEAAKPQQGGAASANTAPQP
jgi:predicted aspartyl protease